MENRKLNILLVEDEILIAMSGQKELEKKGYAVKHVSSGEKAVSSLLDNNLPVDIVLMDIDLGRGIDGTQAAMQILEKKDIPIVFLSSHIEPEIVEKTEKITSYGYVVKNSGIVVLDASIKMAIKLFMSKMENKKASEDLKEKTNEIERFFNIALDLLCVGDIDGNFRRLNPRWEEVLGFSINEITGSNFLSYVHPDDRERTINAFSVLIKHNSALDFINRFRCKDGTYRWIEWRSILHDNILYGSARDITEHKRVEDEINNLKSFYAEILDSIINGVWVTDKDNKVIYTNKGMSSIAGVTTDQLIGINVLNDFPEETIRFFRPKYLESKESLSHVYYEEIPVVTPAGRLSYQSGWLIPRINNGLFDGMICTVEDVTKHKMIEEDIRLNEEKYSKIFRLNPSVMTISTVKDGRFIDVNNAFLSMFGYEKEEVIGKTSHEVGIYADYSQRASIIEEVTKKGSVQGIDLLGRTKEGDIRNGLFSAYRLEIQGDKYILAVINDITERKYIENKLKDQKNRLDSILQGTNAGTWEWNVQTGNTIFNERWAEIIGYSLEEISPVSIDTWVRLCHPDDLKESEKLLQSCFEGNSEFYVCECRMKHKDGRWVWILDRGKVITRTKDGKPEWMYGTHQDITERKNYEEKIKKQLAEKDVLLREVHHRIKNNIANIESFLSLQSGTIINSEAKSIVNNVLSRIQSMRILYDKLLLTGDFQELSIKNYVESLIDSLDSISATEKRIMVVKNIAEFIITAKKAVSIGIFINELVNNAYKHAFNDSETGIISVSIEKNGNNANLIIQDNGKGIDDGTQSSGLGLTIVKMLVEQLDGYLSISNDHGTKINIQLEI